MIDATQPEQRHSSAMGLDLTGWETDIQLYRKSDNVLNRFEVAKK